MNFPIPRQTGLPSGSTFLMDAFNQLHAIVWFYCFIIISLIIILFFNIYLQQFNQISNLKSLILHKQNGIINLKKHPIIYVNPYITYDNWLIELLILIVPFFIVILICIPSTALSYSVGEVHSASASIKVTGEQWAWYNEVIIPVTKFEGYQKEAINNLFFLTKLESKVISNTIIFNNKGFNYYSLYGLQKTKYLYNLTQQRLYDPSLQHLIWIKLNYLQTKLPLINKVNNIENIIARNVYKSEFIKYSMLQGKLLRYSHYLIPSSNKWVDLISLPLQHLIIRKQAIMLLIYLKKIDFLTEQIKLNNKSHSLSLTNIATPIPAMVWTKLTVDALDVIHSYWLWDYGIKLDCIPGNPLQTFIFPKKFGISTGSCAEYCGNGHLNMPIIIKSYDLNEPISYKNL